MCVVVEGVRAGDLRGGTVVVCRGAPIENPLANKACLRASRVPGSAVTVGAFGLGSLAPRVLGGRVGGRV